VDLIKANLSNAYLTDAYLRRADRRGSLSGRGQAARYPESTINTGHWSVQRSAEFRV